MEGQDIPEDADPLEAVESMLQVTVGDDKVTFAYTVRQPESADVPFLRRFRTDIEADVAVYDEDEEEVIWAWSEGRPRIGVINSIKLKPGESRTYEFTWEDPEPGEYKASARFDGGNQLEAVPAEDSFTIEE
jgi:uncharacterized cupredoxin-like copper-binding protein